MSSSTAWVVKKCTFWIRINLATEICLKEQLVNILYNTDNDPSYNGLPSNPNQLFIYMQKCQQNANHDLNKGKGKLSGNQWNVLCPPNQQQTNAKDWDITLLVAVIRSVLKLTPLGGWNIKQLHANDQSKGAFVYLIRNLRNEIKHSSIKEIDTLVNFNLYWNRIEFILNGLNYNNMQFFDNLKTEPLDSHTIAITETVKQMEQNVNNLKKVTTDNAKDIVYINNEINNIIKNDSNKIHNFLTHLDGNKADKEDLKDLEKRMRKMEEEHNKAEEHSTSNSVKTKLNSLKLERGSKKEFLFSARNINISESSFKFKYKTAKEKQWFEVNQENLKIQVAENVVYFLVKGKFLTGCCYSFEMCMESPNGDTICFCYEDHEVRDIMEQRYHNKPSYIAHDDGTNENINVFDIKNLPDEDKKCQLIKSPFEKIADFRKITKQHCKEQGQLRFPPSYYLAEGVTKQFGDELEKLYPADSYIITGYNPIQHLKLLGFTDKHFKDNSIATNISFENVVTVLAPKTSLILVSVIVETDNAEVVKSELHNLNDILKAIYAAAHKNISNAVMKIVGTLILPEISKNNLHSPHFLFIDRLQHCNGKECGARSSLFLTKEQMESKELQIWWNNLSRDIPPSNSFQKIKNVAEEMITSMCVIDSYLPRVTSDTGEKIASLLLNPGQIDVILNSEQWKFIVGPHGSGKSICLKEIAKQLYQRNDRAKVLYVCYDPFSLLETEMTMCFQKVSNDGTLQSLSISDISLKAGFPVDQFCSQLGPPKKTIADLFEYLTKTYGKCHLLVDEFPTENITPQYCEQLKQSLEKNFEHSTLVIATQSSTTTKKIIDNNVTVLEFEKCSLEDAGMKKLSLEKAMRNPSEIFDLTQTSIDCITEKETVLSIPSVISNDAVESEREELPASQVKEPNKNNFTNVSTESYKQSGDIVTPPAKKRKKIMNGTKLVDPQYLAIKNNEAHENQHSELKLETKTAVINGKCGTISSKRKPILFSLFNEFSILDHKSCLVFAEILKKRVLQTKHRISFICNNINEITCVAYALEICEQKFVTYAPFLLGQLPSSEEKLNVTEQLNTQIGSHLIIDYRSCRGCDIDHCVFFIDPAEEYINHALIEMITRTTSTLKMFAYPFTKRKESATCLEKVLGDWIEEEDIDEIKIDVKSKKHKCTIYIADKEHELKIERKNSQIFRNIQQSIYEQDQYNKEETLQ